MSIKATKQPAVHPGRVLSRILEKTGVTQTKLAAHLKVKPSYISDICRGRIGISAEMAKKLGRSFNQSAEFWMQAQMNWELSRAEDPKDLKPLAA